jgi:hypothetical protein
LPLTGYDKYTIDLYVDFAWTALTLIGAPIPAPPGDFNSDGSVDAADYVDWRTDPAAYGDAAGFDTWRAHFGEAAGSASNTNKNVPEPAAVMLFVTALIIAFAANTLKTRSIIHQR